MTLKNIIPILALCTLASCGDGSNANNTYDVNQPSCVLLCFLIDYLGERE